MEIRNDSLVVREASYYLTPASFIDRVHPSVLLAIVFGAFAGMSLAMAVLPFALAGTLIAVLVILAATIRVPERAAVQPAQIRDNDARARYVELLAAYVDLAHALERAHEHDGTQLAASTEMVLACGALALGTNETQRYLEARDLDAVERDHAALASAPPGSADLVSALSASTIERDIVRGLVDARDRVRARLTRARLSIRALTASIVRLHGPIELPEPDDRVLDNAAALAALDA